MAQKDLRERIIVCLSQVPAGFVKVRIGCIALDKWLLGDSRLPKEELAGQVSFYFLIG